MLLGLLRKYGTIESYYESDIMAIPPSIKIASLSILPFTEKHLTDLYLSWLNSPIIMRYSEQRHRNHTLKSCRDYLASFTNSPNFFWAIEEIDLGHIGTINAYIDIHNSIADIGIMIGHPIARGKGYALDTWNSVCHYLFTVMNIRKVTAGSLNVNIPMLRLMKHAGMIDDGVRLKQYVWEGQEVDIIHMALFKCSWINRNWVEKQILIVNN